MRIKKVICKYFPFKGYVAATIYPWIFIRESNKWRYTSTVNRHEKTRALQQVEMLWLGFFLLYGLEYVVKLFFCGFNHTRAYKSISFEQEAYEHQKEITYNAERKHYAWVKYVFKVI